MAMTSDETDEARLDRERRFHNERFAEGGGERRSSRFYSVAGDALREYSERVMAVEPGRRVLEYGCGSGSMAFDLARAGARVVGIDISDVAVAAARARAGSEGLDATFEVMDAEALDLPADSFDLVCGSGILHHLDLERSMSELSRVMAPGGRAVFFEPLGHNPLINLYRRVTPGERTVDEHPLLEADLVAMRDHFARVEVRGYDLFALAALPLRGRTELVEGLQGLDRRVFARWPRAQKMAWTVLVELSEPVELPVGGDRPTP